LKCENKAMPTGDTREPKPPDDNGDANERRSANIFLAVAAIILIGAGVWLVDAMISVRKADECLAAGRRNCAPLDAPAR
jgi:hypothetical protein